MGTVSDTEDYSELSITRNVKIKIELFSTSAFIGLIQDYFLVCVMQPTQTDNK